MPSNSFFCLAYATASWSKHNSTSPVLTISPLLTSIPSIFASAGAKKVTASSAKTFPLTLSSVLISPVDRACVYTGIALLAFFAEFLTAINTPRITMTGIAILIHFFLRFLTFLPPSIGCVVFSPLLIVCILHYIFLYYFFIMVKNRTVFGIRYDFSITYFDHPVCLLCDFIVMCNQNDGSALTMKFP